MNQREQDEIVGRMVRERGDISKQMAILRADLQRVGGALSEIGKALQQSSFDAAASVLATWYDSLEGDHLEVLQKRLNEYNTLAAKLRDYDKNLEEIRA